MIRPRILGIDYGRARHGLAVSDALGMASHPLPALTRRNEAADLAALRALAEERDIRRLVIGLPLNMDGSEGEMAREVRAWGDRLAAALGLPHTYEDERLTSEEAEDVLREAGVRPSQRRGLRDSIAAAVILRAVLEREAREEGEERSEPESGDVGDRPGD